MAIRPIVLFPDPVLLRPTREVEVVDDELRALIEDMKETMYAAPGIGLAANQIGLSLRLCVVDLTAGEEEGHFHAFVNPRILTAEGEDRAEEGCLSFPDVHVEVTRPERITVEALDAQGESFQMEADGMMAKAIQHECEHLDGHTFLRNVSNLKRDLIKRQIRKRIKNGDWVSVV